MSYGSTLGNKGMTSRRQLRLCVIETEDGPATIRLSELSVAGAVAQANARPPIGSEVVIHHEIAGSIAAIISEHSLHGFSLSFQPGTQSVNFAMTAIASDMTVCS